MIDFSTPLAGMNLAAATVNAAATRIASPASPQSDPTADIVSLSEGQAAFALNAKAERVQQDIAQTLLDIMA